MMTFNVYKTSDSNFSETLAVNSLDQLVNFIKECGHDVVVGKTDLINENGNMFIEIYDDYRE